MLIYNKHIFWTRVIYVQKKKKILKIFNINKFNIKNNINLNHPIVLFYIIILLKFYRAYF